MIDKRVQRIGLIGLLGLMAAILAGVYFQSFDLLLNILLSVSGILIGIITNAHFAERSEKQNLGRYASTAHRLSVDIYDSLNETIEKIEDLQKGVENQDGVTNTDVYSMLEIISGKLRIIQRFSLSANSTWKEVLPPDELVALSKREQRIGLSDEKDLVLTEEKHVIQRQKS
jgi:hypothetical protein